MSIARRCIAKTWLFSEPAASRQASRAILSTSVVRRASKDVQSRPAVVFPPPPANKFGKLRARRMELFAKRIKALEKGLDANALEHPPSCPPLQFKKIVAKEPPAPGPDEQTQVQVDNPQLPEDSLPGSEKQTQVAALSANRKESAEKSVWPLIKTSSPSYLLRTPTRHDLQRHLQRAQSSRLTALGTHLTLPGKSSDTLTPSQLNHGSLQEFGHTVFYRAVNVTQLDPMSTLTDLTQAIAAAGPFGMVTSASVKEHEDASTRRVEVVFHSEDAARKFTTHATTNGFRVGAAAPVVAHDTVQGFASESRHRAFSRVLRVFGDRRVEGFDEAALRRILAAKFNRDPDEDDGGDGGDAGWLASEPPRTTWFPDGSKAIDWAFFSNQHQTRPFQAALWEHFAGKLFVGYGVDPCGHFGDTGVQDGPRAFRSVFKG